MGFNLFISSGFVLYNLNLLKISSGGRELLPKLLRALRFIFLKVLMMRRWSDTKSTSSGRTEGRTKFRDYDYSLFSTAKGRRKQSNQWMLESDVSRVLDFLIETRKWKDTPTLMGLPAYPAIRSGLGTAELKPARAELSCIPSGGFDMDLTCSRIRSFLIE
ncbi:trans-resveratrol di-O-methyltransferase [Striga asiatica]|uniref:Trans-resveratrol di-O-methyltransferase n=1 Tax=Striga asiatica TaxID=4170 RepID=A0A5A7QH92_STRAF|nr:trans-resveratrol di-O-methyltransferase [Striga asiatica]